MSGKITYRRLNVSTSSPAQGASRNRGEIIYSARDIPQIERAVSFFFLYIAPTVFQGNAKSVKINYTSATTAIDDDDDAEAMRTDD